MTPSWKTINIDKRDAKSLRDLVKIAIECNQRHKVSKIEDENTAYRLLNQIEEFLDEMESIENLEKRVKDLQEFNLLMI